MNLLFNYTNIANTGLSVGVGCYDMMDVNYAFIQPYNGGFAPLPQPTREFIVKLSYNFNFKK